MSVSRANNRKDGLGGLLIYTNGSFLQVLEGNDEKVYRRFERIMADPRHSYCDLLYDDPIFEPDFGEWMMGFWTDSVTTNQRASGIIAVPNLLQELDSVWLERKSHLNNILQAEILALRMPHAA